MQLTSQAVVGILLMLCDVCYGFEIAGRCIKYKNNEEMYTYIGGSRLCLEQGKFTYCREWVCHPKCSTFNGWPGVCEECKDTCADIGQLFTVGEAFKCADNGNNCKCGINNAILSTRKAQSVKNMCFDKLREINKE